MGLGRSEIEHAPRLDAGYSVRSVMAKAVAAAIMLAALVAGGAFYASGTSLFAASSGDDVSDADKQARLEAFNSIKFLLVSKVADKDISAAIDTMHLAPADKAQLQAQIGNMSSASAPSDAHVNASGHRDAGTKPEMVAAVAAVAKVASGALRSPAPSSAASGAPMTLAWVRLWDSDVEDGDVVRIDSAGYSRTVSLTNRGLIFAIPVPASGQVRITGVRDGDGGGITVGLASGSAQTILPIMSVGQVLTLNVRTN
jgi:hypothetical protein